MVENIPPVFNGHLNLRAAYDWNQAQVPLLLARAVSILKRLLILRLGLYVS
jgi:hypothetical protein